MLPVRSWNRGLAVPTSNLSTRESAAYQGFRVDTTRASPGKAPVFSAFNRSTGHDPRVRYTSPCNLHWYILCAYLRFEAEDTVAVWRTITMFKVDLDSPTR